MTVLPQTGTMTRHERQALAAMTVKRATLAKARSKQLDAERKADVERQLATIFRADDERWAAIMEQADAVSQEADAKVQAILDAAGVPKQFRPTYRAYWSGRGENALAERRNELRRAAYARIAADGQAARLEIERTSLDVQTELLAEGLTTGAARRFLASMPTADDLMPRLDVLSLDAARVFAGLVTAPSATAALSAEAGDR